jgi:putative ABC transport system permease protein
MLKNYFKTACRNLVKSKGHSLINIAGLSIGMAVAMLIGFWIYDEVSFNRAFPNHDRIGQLWQFVSFTSEKTSFNSLPIPLAQELRAKYPDFRYVSLSVNRNEVLGVDDKKISVEGNFTEPDFASIVSLQMISGDRRALKDPHSILISESLAKNLFGKANPINKIISINGKQTLSVAGIYGDFPSNSEFSSISFLGPWSFYETLENFAKDSKYEWDANSWQIYAQLKEGADFAKVSAKIKDIRVKRDNPPGYKPEFFIHPMNKWHLYGEFINGVNTGGLITYVWLFGIIGLFVLMLACINFMNLSTAKSEKRAKEVGIRKAIGSMRSQLILQFLSESLLVVALAFLFSLIIVQLVLPYFNEVAGKQMKILVLSPAFWILGLGFSLITGLIAGSYPALYLSSFRPVRVLKGTFRVGRFASLPRKVLVVLQFSVSVTLIIGTFVVFRQIQFAKNRPVGYERARMIEINMNTPGLIGHLDALRNDLINSQAVENLSVSSGSVTVQYGGTTDFSWKGKAANSHPLIMSNNISVDYGRTVGWHLAAGRDFSSSFSGDSSSMVLNMAAVRLMGFRNPVGESVTFHGRNYLVIGVTDDMVKESPFKPVTPSLYVLSNMFVNIINIKLSSRFGLTETLAKVEGLFKKYNPSSPFDYKFVDEEYSRKFFNEERIGKLASSFAVLAIFISCLGLFGLASFVAEQRTKEIGVRKVLGATVVNLWGLLSREFVMLVIISLGIAMPVAYYFMAKWLLQYEYRAPMSWWIFVVAGAGALTITLVTVSFHGIKAAMANPVKSLRTE